MCVFVVHIDRFTNTLLLIAGGSRGVDWISVPHEVRGSAVGVHSAETE